jgi:NitT/TauT family transport system permease protein
VAATAAVDRTGPVGRFWRARTPALLLGQLGVIVVLLAAWELLADYAGTDFWTSSPSEIVDQISRWVRDGDLWNALAVTLTETLGGFALGAAVGAVVGFVLGWSRVAGDILEPIILPFYALPKVALAPLFVLVFGVGISAKVMLVALMVFFIVFFITFRGTRAVDRDLVVIARVMGASRVDTWRTIALPHSSVWMLSGLRLALPSAFHGAVVGEFIAASAGVGFLIRKSTATFNTTGVFAGVVVLLVAASILIALVKRVEQWVLRWQSTTDLGTPGKAR